MKIVDPPGLWEMLVWGDLAEKRICDMSLNELELLADALAEFTDGLVPPYWNGKDLIVPFAAPHACKWWRHKFKPAERLKLLREAGVPEDKYSKYMSERDIGMALGRVDESGNEIGRTDGEERAD